MIHLFFSDLVDLTVVIGSQDKDNLYFVMDYIPGGDLMSLLIKLGIFEEPLARYQSTFSFLFYHFFFFFFFLSIIFFVVVVILFIL